MNDGREKLKRMRMLATGLLVVMAVTYGVSRTLEETMTAWAWVRAFSEAAMVGALADWFAVTALFRHPLGLPIPHTAIVREEKERIGALVGQFVRGSFFTREEVSRQWKDWRPVERLAGWLSSQENAERAVQRVAGTLPALMAKTDGMELSRMGAEKLREGLQGLPVGRLVSVLLEGFLRSPSRRQVLAPVLGRLSLTVAQNRDWVMDEARKGAPMRGAKILGAVTEVAAMMMSGKAIEKLSAELESASKDEAHPLFDKIEEALGQTLEELESSGGSEWEAFKERVLADPETQAVLEEVIRGVGRYTLAEARNLEEGGDGGRWSEMISGMSHRLLDDPEKLDNLESTIEKAVAGFFERYGEGIEKIISRTVDSWEADDLIERLENQVGPDLQFIRINGTLIGGCVGLLLHGLGVLIWG
ncbi:DUF445 domain-containing protein [Roseibacillus persicicus]|uniref:DUF445 domain-containing protein n=1 Tax=Roseibacillus persicicus TaxID=454148 RepID=A0A918TSC9_9BACT|nr:DUF445 domain-containing protein [Roseibacillus persicicus]MDQ8190843.1 DUF445 domain-containing protein [Roseibacillus persicicus]GHC61017.1 hypothetical protein GCM10007100_30350 [Roseibacillus persicicus]